MDAKYSSPGTNPVQSNESKLVLSCCSTIDKVLNLFSGGTNRDGSKINRILRSPLVPDLLLRYICLLAGRLIAYGFVELRRNAFWINSHNQKYEASCPDCPISLQAKNDQDTLFNARKCHSHSTCELSIRCFGLGR